jgi:hypothetical protein
MTVDSIENISSNIASLVFDSAELTTRRAIDKKAEVERLRDELAETRNRIENIRALLESSTSSPNVEFEPPALSGDQSEYASSLSKSVAMLASLTASNPHYQSDGTFKMVCGNIPLKSGATFEGLQANWDLIDTATGADIDE